MAILRIRVGDEAFITSVLTVARLVEATSNYFVLSTAPLTLYYFSLGMPRQ
jgi:hypothetical protein